MWRNLWTHGYRPFFLLAGVNAWASMALWLYLLSGRSVPTQGWPPQSLHAHEMIYGTVVAVIAGFLLTAVPNWTSTARVAGAPLVGLVLLFMLGRLALLLAGFLDPVWVAWVDVAFLPVLAVFVARPILQTRNWRNLPVVAVLVGLALANASIHGGLLRPDYGMLRTGTYASVYLVVVLMIIISGRIVPAFTRNALRKSGLDAPVVNRVYIGPLAVAAACSALALELISPGNPIGAGLALVAAVFLFMRQSGWQFGKTLGRPMLWVLHVGHAWLAVGFGCLGVSSVFGIGIGAAALHAFTAGAMGTLILAMMPRVSLGHQGRPIEATRATVWMFALVIVGALIRIVGASGSAAMVLPSVLIGGCIWSSAWLVFTISYTRILFEPSK
jgi:uncharacterized protein involved in response to NO